MPAISKIRFTNIIYDNKQKRFNDDIFNFSGHNTAVLLENGGGKTVFIQCAMQAIIPHTDLGERKIKETLLLDNTCAHIAIEWILRDRPRKYCVTAVSLYKDSNGGVASYRFINEYSADSKDSIEFLPFSLESENGRKRSASREEISEYYTKAKAGSMAARTFNTIHEYQDALSKDYGIIASEWRSQLEINKKEGGVEEFFDGCSTTGHLVDNLLIPSIEAVIAGDGEKGFAKTFENQRDTFKEYNRLMHLIAESDMATERLNTYVKEYGTLNERQIETLKAQRQAKALYKLAGEELTGLTEQYSSLNGQREALVREREMLTYKQESLIVFERENELKAAERDFAEALDAYEKRKEIYDEKAKLKENIMLHSAQHKIKELEADIQSVEEMISRLEEDADIEELRDAYEKHAGLLKGCYVGIEEDINKRLAKVNLEIKKYTEEKNYLQNVIDTENQKLNALNSDKSRFNGAYSANSKKIDELKRKIMIDAKNERADEALIVYNKRLTEIETAQSALDSEINDMDKRASDIKAELPFVREKRDTVNEQALTVKNELLNIGYKINKLVSALSANYKEFYNLKQSNFYSKEKTIRENFETIIYKAKTAKDKALLNERLKKRLSDAYDESEYFTGSPEPYDIIEKLKNRFDFIQDGGQYVNRVVETLGIPRDEILAKFPFWHYAIIVNEANISKLKDELNERELTGPVLILTLDKAREIVSGINFDIDSVMPEFWVSNLDSESFVLWKNRIKAQGEAAEEDRREAEETLSRLREDEKDVRDLFSDCPNERYAQMIDEKMQLENLLSDLIKQENESVKELDNVEARRRSSVSKKNDLVQEAMHVNMNREYAQNILKLEDENKGFDRDIMRLDEQIEKEAADIEAQKRNLRNTEENIELLIEEKVEVSKQQSALQNEEWYKTVWSNTPDMRGNMKKNVLIEKLKSLDLELMKVSTDRKVLDEKIAGYKSKLEMSEKQFRDLKEEAKYPWDEQGEYYDGMELELSSLNRQLPPLLGDMNNQKAKMDNLDKILAGKKMIYDEDLKKFKSKYEDLYLFRQSLQETKATLRDEETTLVLKTEAVKKEILKAENEKKEAEKAFDKLAAIDREFKFNGIDAEGEEFSDALNYSYNRLKVVENMDTGLERVFSLMRAEELRVNNAKRIYFEQCRREISDIRNRDKLIELVERATNYTELTTGQAAMNVSLERAKILARAAIAEREEKMFQFTNHLYTHVEKIAKELLLIPKKTRIRTEDGWKEIFDISFAEWDEKEARMALRAQVNYILDRIENNRDFKAEDGTEDLPKIKAFIEKSLKTKQLLKKIMGSNEIRVRCRKVTNDNQVSGRFCSWEESEKWSGGERWSKNMALFLGIQNYIAEKTEPDLKAGKAKSCVLLDNPFGKASSEHVLNPVFFIAAELGFQIITVTAHAEGKFISDYFPVVYSLKLREASGGNTSIITKELNIKHAYFEDKDPIEMSRLKTKEQLTLF